jgi:hypothetical protein
MKKACCWGGVSCLVLAAMLSQSLTASASDLITSSTTSTVSSEFTADAENVASGIIVQLPANLDLSYVESIDDYQVNAEIGVYGDVSDYMEVKISLPSTIVYTNEDKSATANGLVRFGDEDDGVSYEIWNAAQVAAGKDSADDIDKRNITVNVPVYDISNADDYSSDVKFDITLEVIGATTDICAPTATKIYSNVGTKYGDATPWQCKSTSEYENKSINLASLTPSSTNTYNIIKNISYDDEYAQYYLNVKYLQMYSGTQEYPLYYGINKWTSSDDSLTTEAAIKECTSWCYLYHNLQVLVIPSDIQSDALHRSAIAKEYHVSFSGWYDGWAAEVVDTTDLTFPDSSIAVGNALCFVRDLNEKNQFVYVPHIVYRGTIEQWKALSGEDDWIFGNISNVVTVHCTDGILYY